MKAILDTNVFVSGIYFSGPPSTILKAAMDQQFELIASPEILDEFNAVGNQLETKYGNMAFSPIFSIITSVATVVTAPPLKKPLCADLDDDKFYACAIASGTKVIVSGDKHLLDVSGYREVNCIKPRKFLDQYLKKQQQSLPPV